MKVHNLRPNPYLCPYISRYWVWEQEANLPKLLPGTGTELMFHYGQSLLGENQAGNVFVVPDCYVISPRHGYYLLQPVKKMGFFAVRFRAGAFRHFCRQSNEDLIDTFIDIRDVWGAKGQKFGQEVIEAKTLEERIMIVEQGLMELLSLYQRPEYWLDAAVQKMLYHYNAANMQEVSSNFGISYRQLQRKFKEAVGVTPKKFQQISRFESVIKHLLLNQQQDYLGTALEHGYYDQSHFIKDFKAYVGEHPSLFLQDKNFMSHFYNRKLPN